MTLKPYPPPKPSIHHSRGVQTQPVLERKTTDKALSSEASSTKVGPKEEVRGERQKAEAWCPPRAEGSPPCPCQNQLLSSATPSGVVISRQILTIIKLSASPHIFRRMSRFKTLTVNISSQTPQSYGLSWALVQRGVYALHTANRDLIRGLPWAFQKWSLRQIQEQALSNSRCGQSPKEKSIMDHFTLKPTIFHHSQTYWKAENSAREGEWTSSGSLWTFTVHFAGPASTVEVILQVGVRERPSVKADALHREQQNWLPGEILTFLWSQVRTPKAQS